LLNFTETKYLSIGKHGHSVPLELNDAVKCGGNYKYLRMKGKEEGVFQELRAE
jgi:hypothetical protein